MTGLPMPPLLPPPPAGAATAAAAARAWIETAAAAHGLADDVRGSVARAPDWGGAAAVAARARAARESDTLTSHAARGLAQATAVARWAAVVTALSHAWAALAARRTSFSERRDRLEPVPDSDPSAPALRQGIEADHTALSGAIRRWASACERADQQLADDLRQPAAPSALQALDAAWRSLLALDTSAAGRSTREALAGGDGPTYLLDYEPERFHGDGAVVISFGDPTTADEVAVVVPGITNDASTMADVGALALAVGQSAERARPATTTAAIAWLGYDAPSGGLDGRLDPRHLDDLARTLTPSAADAGAGELALFVDRLGAETSAEITVVGHSYGSTTAAIAARRGMDADRLVLLGSPGAGPGAMAATDLHLPVWVASDDLDPVTWVGSADRLGGPGALGADPAQEGFGATRLPTGLTAAPHLDQALRLVDIHLGYLRPDSPTAAAVGTVVTGQAPPTVPGRTRGGTELAARWLAGQVAYELTSWR
ncbi:alpha/beta hydrolase [Nocardioides jiangxiensis]|uniref:Alpha/beta hydrolase n=1 Tax=Nocardioides jiangxiensis TaxID=3064524 RepID=A0ABT9AYU1_9ACTN|nr:alpha/beta hydrolase [Nocardioides sp. WY-20]MDO7867103.1 alpha/beta hydrolase [Nocardioides sp. WY-20]